jgi:hypothetical protein
MKIDLKLVDPPAAGEGNKYPPLRFRGTCKMFDGRAQLIKGSVRVSRCDAAQCHVAQASSAGPGTAATLGFCRRREWLGYLGHVRR